MIGRFLTQTATWQQTTDRDGYGKALVVSTTIPVRWEYKRRIVRSTTGQEVVSEARLFTTAAVSVGDAIVDPDGRSWTVLSVSPQYDLSGREMHREVAL